MEEINACGYQQNWKQDSKGYFLIRIKNDFIEVGHCKNSNKPEKIIIGNTPEEIMYKIVDLGLISQLDHAAYLGKELQKAFDCLKTQKNYIQDEAFK